MSDQEFFPALANADAVKEFSSRLLELVGVFQAALHNISEADRTFAGSGYGVLMEVYGLRTRAYILMNDPESHIVNSLEFSQDEMLSLFDRVSSVTRAINSLKIASAMVLSVATFTVSLGEDRARIVNFLFNALRHDVAEWEALFN
ncbi:hypothetical protein I4984_22210 [Pseudomonas aeruginosa]|uniref:hypothetical protein n=1 Tax=Pseudomonadaceae TaxID=135621 RepID=UPI000AF90A4E|nr:MULTISPECIES: hypothetical protein [Pseudomonadaceae]HEM7588866.1 hypothetical protein [Serratia marcescens]EKX3945768.1 hypothetical protein [Pseudomonas aeruginosa]EKX3952432.1 hypothetical protein [Pseudomonas aeruginosa]MBG4032932.1 hypothetical protein [Pseudomonas aeruginosa]MBG4180904.1 hypothetical protein [Pseudomonas aeruginosa]